MKFLAALITCVAFVSALPSPELQSGNSLGSTALPTRDVAGCNPGQLYCFGQIIHDLGVDKQNILHQYCRDQSNVDAQSCHACTRPPWPLDTCWAGRGAWNSVFECKGGQEFEFKFRCEEWCEAATCIARPKLRGATR